MGYSRPYKPRDLARLLSVYVYYVCHSKHTQKVAMSGYETTAIRGYWGWNGVLLVAKKSKAAGFVIQLLLATFVVSKVKVVY